MSLVLDASNLLNFHTLTRDVSQLWLRQLKIHVETLTPLFRPRRFLGDHIEGTGKEAIAGADKNFEALQELYRKVAIRPFDLRPELKAPLESVASQFQFHEWEYTHAVQTEHGWQQIRVTTPLSWVITYASPYSVAALTDVVAGTAARDTEAVRAFVLRACLISELFRKFPALIELFRGLQFKVEIRRSVPLGDLPLVIVSAPFNTIRPADNLVAMASGLAGGASFAEVLDVENVSTHSDPLRDATLKLIRGHGVEV